MMTLLRGKTWTPLGMAGTGRLSSRRFRWEMGKKRRARDSGPGGPKNKQDKDYVRLGLGLGT